MGRPPKTQSPWEIDPLSLTLRLLFTHALDCAADYLSGAATLIRPIPAKRRPRARRKAPVLSLEPSAPGSPYHHSESRTFLEPPPPKLGPGA